MPVVPGEVLLAAVAAFDGRHPGSTVLDLVTDSREGNGSHAASAAYVLRFGNRHCQVLLTVTPARDLVDLGVAVFQEGQVARVALEHFTPTLRLTRELDVHAGFHGVPHGFVCVTGAVGDHVVWSTAWTHL